jgi:hypothetical protein
MKIHSVVMDTIYQETSEEEWASFGRAVVESLKEENGATDDIEEMAIQSGLYTREDDDD